SFTYTLSDGRGGTDQGNVSLTVQAGPAGETLFTGSEGPTGSGFNDNTAMEESDRLMRPSGRKPFSTSESHS
ncbi:hypothetical protein ACC754_44515, partial [Rhizobium johnstonii]